MPEQQNNPAGSDDQAQGANAGAGGVAQGANAGTGTGSAGTGGDQAQGAGNHDDETPEQLRARIAALSKEAGGYRTKLRDAEARIQQGERAGMDDAERIAAELADAKAEADRLREELAGRVIGDAVAKVAKVLKFHDPADALAHIDRKAVVDEDGKVDDAKVSALLTELVKAKPYLATAVPNGDANGGRDQSGSGKTSMNDIIRGKARG